MIAKATVHRHAPGGLREDQPIFAWPDAACLPRDQTPITPHSIPGESQGAGSRPSAQIDYGLAFSQLRNIGKEIAHALLPIMRVHADEAVIQRREPVRQYRRLTNIAFCKFAIGKDRPTSGMDSTLNNNTRACNYSFGAI